MKNPNTFHIVSLGCVKNQVDSEYMISVLQRDGWKLTKSPDTSQVIIINTCGFIDEARKESIETALQLKSEYEDCTVIMAGCLTQRYGDTLWRELPEIDGFIGNRAIQTITQAVEEAVDQRRPLIYDDGKENYPGLYRERFLSHPGSAFVKIAEGCNNRCTYCSIPLIRGELKSRSCADIIQEIERLIDQGIHEVILVAQDLSAYGDERRIQEGSRNGIRNGVRELPILLEKIAAIKKDFWIRLLYIHPDHFPEMLVSMMKSETRILPYFDIPFQHASKRILSAMGRKGNMDLYLALIAKVREQLPQAVIRSTFLVGFPGEQDEDFSTLLDFQEKASLDWLGVFTYSREEDTPAYHIKGRVRKEIAQSRKHILEKAQIVITEERLERFIGRHLSVIVEEVVAGSAMAIARGYIHAPDVDGVVIVKGRDVKPGGIYDVVITKRIGFDLEAELCRTF